MSHYAFSQTKLTLWNTSTYNVNRMTKQQAVRLSPKTRAHCTHTAPGHYWTLKTQKYDTVFAYLANTLSLDKQTRTLNPVELHHGLEKVHVCVCVPRQQEHLTRRHRCNPRDFTSTTSQHHPASLLTGDAKFTQDHTEHMPRERYGDRQQVSLWIFSTE